MSEVRTAPKRLVDLGARWGTCMCHPDRKLYLVYRCPCDEDPCPRCGPDREEWVPVANPVDGGPPTSDLHPGPGNPGGWQRMGDTFETLTLNPSVHAVGHWHGWIRNGMVESC